jgi:hypothetical protein
MISSLELIEIDLTNQIVLVLSNSDLVPHLYTHGRMILLKRGLLHQTTDAPRHNSILNSPRYHLALRIDHFGEIENSIYFVFEGLLLNGS